MLNIQKDNPSGSIVYWFSHVPNKQRFPLFNLRRKHKTFSGFVRKGVSYKKYVKLNVGYLLRQPPLNKGAVKSSFYW